MTQGETADDERWDNGWETTCVNGRDKQKDSIVEVEDSSETNEYKRRRRKGTTTCEEKNPSILSSRFLSLE